MLCRACVIEEMPLATLSLHRWAVSVWSGDKEGKWKFRQGIELFEHVVIDFPVSLVF